LADQDWIEPMIFKNFADQDWIEPMIFKNFADQDWIGSNFIGSGLDSEWKISQSAHLCKAALPLAFCTEFNLSQKTHILDKSTLHEKAHSLTICEQ